MQHGKAVVHDKAYYLKAIISDGGRPKVIFRSDASDDLEIAIDDDGRLAVRQARIEAV